MGFKMLTAVTNLKARHPKNDRHRPLVHFQLAVSGTVWVAAEAIPSTKPVG